MFPSLKSKLLAVISGAVILVGLAIAGIASQRYSRALKQEMRGQAENLAHSLALEAADRILIHDLVGLQKLLDHYRHSQPDVAYLFVLREGQVLAHTFEQGVPAALVEANRPGDSGAVAFKEVLATTRERYLDTAFPIFEGKAGVLRLGFSEKRYNRQLLKLWGEMGLITLTLLLAALGCGLLIVRRLTRPLAALVTAARDFEQGKTPVRVTVQGRDEIAALAQAFNQMVARQEDYTRRLEDQTQELERAYAQARTVCQIVQEVSALCTLKEMGALLLHKLGETLDAPVALVLLNSSQDTVFLLTERGVSRFQDVPLVEAVCSALRNPAADALPQSLAFRLAALVPNLFTRPHPVLIPFSDQQFRGAAVVACPERDAIRGEPFKWAALVLKQNAGALARALTYEEGMGGLESRVEAQAGFGELIGKDPKMQVIYKLIEDVAASEATVLIQGESGTGKELVARTIHRLSPRRDRPLVVINCSAYPPTLLESELFGHEKGAFTGATRQKPGRFEQAQGGTVFLDEVGDIPPAAQIKLLRVLQTRKFERVGGEKTLSVDVRLLAATNKDLRQEVARGNFREDLFYRLNVIPIKLPPLRERPNDIPLLAFHFLRRFAPVRGKDLKDISPGAMRALLNYPWPGNVRELENAIEHAVVLAKSQQLEVWDLPPAIRQPASGAGSSLADQKLNLLLNILEECGGNKKLAAKRLGISRSTVYALLKKHQGTKSTTH